VVERQRPALLETGGNIYAAFGSFCDYQANSSRGWLLGWNATTLAPLGSNELTNTQAAIAPPRFNFFLSSIWMSGYGIAGDGAGNLFFTTGNSNPQQNTYTGTTNIQESAVKMPDDLTRVLDIFTPSNVFPLDTIDYDYGAGGVLVLPDQPGPVPHLAVAGGKDGRLFILNRDDMGGFHVPDVPAFVQIGNCWCGESYYKGADGIGRVVTSGGGFLPGGNSQSRLQTWTVNTALSPALTFEGASPALGRAPQDPGFFTSLSSNGTGTNTAIIWAVARPTGPDSHLTLYAFDATASGQALPLLFSHGAGFWPNLNANANLVPTVANGMVYVASYRQLVIFGLTSPKNQSEVEVQHPTVIASPKLTGAIYWGRLKSVHGSKLVVVLRNGKSLSVDLSPALAAGTAAHPVVGSNFSINGTFNAEGVLEARFLWRAKGPMSWGTDSAG
jgi:hypothetical protein